MPRLENWSIGTVYISPYQTPEAMARHINGTIYDDKGGRFPDGKKISTSMVTELNLKEGYVQTRNTRYILGEPDKEYIGWLEEQGLSLEDYVK